ncbi:MAG: DUF1273 domain-containing protein [Ruminococcaceae bacterium]|nr:DUF1273 domain-containing protein [Oscillospiraceae bacterium]
MRSDYIINTPVPKENTAVFIGSNNCTGIDTEHLKAVIIQYISKGVTLFLSGGMGGFDRLCAGMVHRLKDTYPHIKSCLVLPYLDFKIFDNTLFDCTDFPECLESVPYHARIIRRNRYMADCSAYAICYLHSSFGGAAKTRCYAEKKQLIITDVKKLSKDRPST